MALKPNRLKAEYSIARILHGSHFVDKNTERLGVCQKSHSLQVG